MPRLGLADKNQTALEQWVLVGLFTETEGVAILSLRGVFTKSIANYHQGH